MKEFYPLHSAYTRLPPALHGLTGLPPASVFKYIFSDVLLELIAKKTNAYVEAERETSLPLGRHWVAVTSLDLKCWIGICIYMGLFSAPALEDFWKHDGLHPTHPITKYKSITRFE